MQRGTFLLKNDKKLDHQRKDYRKCFANNFLKFQKNQEPLTSLFQKT